MSALCLVLRQRQLHLIPACQTVLKVSERFLEKSSKNQKGLYLFKREGVDPDDYRGVIDWLLASIFPEWKESIMMYYMLDNDSLLLRNTCTAVEISKLDKAMYLCLLSAKEVFKRNIETTNEEFFISCREILEQSIPISITISKKYHDNPKFRKLGYEYPKTQDLVYDSDNGWVDDYESLL